MSRQLTLMEGKADTRVLQSGRKRLHHCAASVRQRLRTTLDRIFRQDSLNFSAFSARLRILTPRDWRGGKCLSNGFVR